MKEQKGIITKQKQNPKLSQHYIQVQFSPLRCSYKHLAVWTHHCTSGHSWLPVLARVLLSSARGPSETPAELTPVSAQGATHPALTVENPCSLLPAQPPPRCYPVSTQAPVNLTVHRAGELISLKHNPADCFSLGSSFQWHSLSIHTNACAAILQWTTADRTRQRREDERGSSDYRDGDLSFQHHLQFESHQILQPKSLTVSSWNQNWRVFKNTTTSSINSRSLEGSGVKKICHIGCDSKTKTCPEPILLLWAGLLSGSNLSECFSPGLSPLSAERHYLIWICSTGSCCQHFIPTRDTHIGKKRKTHQPFRQRGLHTAGSDEGSQRIVLGGWNEATGGVVAQPTCTAQGDVYGLAAGVQAAHRLVPKAVLAHCRRAAGVGAPRQTVGRSWVCRAGAGSQGRLVEICVFTIEGTAAPTAQHSTARWGVKVTLLVHGGMRVGDDYWVFHIFSCGDGNLFTRLATKKSVKKKTAWKIHRM